MVYYAVRKLRQQKESEAQFQFISNFLSSDTNGMMNVNSQGFDTTLIQREFNFYNISYTKGLC